MSRRLDRKLGKGWEEALKAAFVETKSIQRAAQRVGLGYSKARSTLVEMGVDTTSGRRENSPAYIAAEVTAKRMLKDGATRWAVQKATNLSRKTIWNLCRELELAPGAPLPVAVLPKEHDVVAAAVLDAGSMTEAARFWGVTRNAVSLRIKRILDRGLLPPALHASLTELLKKNGSPRP